MWALGMLNTWGRKKINKENEDFEVEYSKLDFVDKVEIKIITSNLQERLQPLFLFKIKEITFDRHEMKLYIKGTLGEVRYITLRQFQEFIGEEI